MENRVGLIDVCLIIRQDGLRGEGFSYCFNRGWRNNQVTPSHSTNFSADYLELTGGIANGDKGTAAEGRDVGPVNACIGIGSQLAKRASQRPYSPIAVERFHGALSHSAASTSFYVTRISTICSTVSVE